MATTDEQQIALNAIHAMNLQAMQLNKTLDERSNLPKAAYRSDVFHDPNKLQVPANPELVKLTKGTAKRGGFDPSTVIKADTGGPKAAPQPNPNTTQPPQVDPQSLPQVPLAQQNKQMKIAPEALGNDKTRDIIEAAEKINSMYRQFSRVLNMLEKKIASGATEVNIKIKFNNEGNSPRQKSIPQTLPPADSQDGGGGSSQAEDQRQPDPLRSQDG